MREFAPVGRFLTIASIVAATAAALDRAGFFGTKKAVFELNQVHILLGATVGLLDIASSR